LHPRCSDGATEDAAFTQNTYFLKVPFLDSDQVNDPDLVAYGANTTNYENTEAKYKRNRVRSIVPSDAGYIVTFTDTITKNGKTETRIEDHKINAYQISNLTFAVEERLVQYNVNKQEKILKAYSVSRYAIVKGIARFYAVSQDEAHSNRALTASIMYKNKLITLKALENTHKPITPDNSNIYFNAQPAVARKHVVDNAYTLFPANESANGNEEAAYFSVDDRMESN
jgi:hypothetical protein